MTMKEKKSRTLTYVLITALLVFGGYAAWSIAGIHRINTAHQNMVSEAATYRAEVEASIRTAAAPSGEKATDIRKYLAAEIGSTRAAFEQAVIGSDEKGGLNQRLNALEELRDRLQELYTFEGELKDPHRMPRSPEALGSRRGQLDFIRDGLAKAMRNFQAIMKREAGG